MGSSTVTLQSVVDVMATTGSVSVAQAAGGYSSLTWLAIADDVQEDLISQRFNWKWNQFKLPSFMPTSFQCDYATVGQKGIGWLESGIWTDINSTTRPKPRYPIEAARQIQPTTFIASPPLEVCWMKNSSLEQGVWPGPGKLYTYPLGASPTPSNPPTNILDPHSNILILTTYGVTGATAPDAGANAAAAAVVNDGTCIWTVADPNAQGFRITPMPPDAGVVYQIDLLAQATPPQFRSLSQTIDPIPDDYSATFRAGVYVYCHKYSADPNMRRDFPQMRMLWLQEIAAALKQGDREPDDAGFVPSRSVMGDANFGDIGPGNPYGRGWYGR